MQYAAADKSGTEVERFFPHTEEGLADSCAFARRNGLAVWNVVNGECRYLLHHAKFNAGA
jgi:hypothetical protein